MTTTINAWLNITVKNENRYFVGLSCPKQSVDDTLYIQYCSVYLSMFCQINELN